MNALLGCLHALAREPNPQRRAELLEQFRQTHPDHYAQLRAIHDEASQAAPSPLTAPPPWRVLGDYALEQEPIGAGAMGTVHRAEQRSLRRPVAVKRLKAGVFASAAARAAFLEEAGRAGRLLHPAIVPIIEAGEADGECYYAMRLIPGRSLKEALAAGTFDPERAARLVQRLAYAVHSAHQEGVIHCDIKPANILLDRDGEAWVTDFGVARQVGAKQRENLGGTPAYMAPEQQQGRAEAIGPATDVYALGLLLTELLTGTPDRNGPSAAVPANLRAICRACLRLGRVEYATARELADDLGRYLDHQEVRARPAPRWEQLGRWAYRRPAVAALLGLLFASLAAVGVVLAVSNRRITGYAGELEEAVGERDRTNEQLEKANDALKANEAKLTNALGESRRRLMMNYVGNGLDEYGRDSHAALAWFAAALSEADAPDDRRAQQLRISGLMRRMARVHRVLPHEAEVKQAVYGGAGKRHILTRTERVVRLWDAGTFATVATFAHPAEVRQALFRPGTAEVLTTASDGKLRLWRVGAVKPATERTFAEAGLVGFDATGQRVVLTGPWKKGRSFEGTAFVWDVVGDTLWPIPDQEHAILIAKADPTGKHVAFFKGRHLYVWDLAHLDAGPRLISHAETLNVVQFSNRGRLLVSSGRTVEVYDPATGRRVWAEPLTLPGPLSTAYFTTYDEAVQLAHDGGATWHDGATGKPFVSAQGHDALMSGDAGWLSADQRFTLVLRGPSVHVVDQAGTLAAAPFVPVPPAAEIQVAAFDHDGRRVVIRTDKTGPQVFRVEGMSGEFKADAPFAAAFSPTDPTLALANRRQLLLVDEKGKVIHQAGLNEWLTSSLHFSRDGRTLAAVGFGSKIDLFDVKGRKGGWTLDLGKRATIYGVDLSPDGRFLLTTTIPDKGSVALRLWDVPGRRLARELLSGKALAPGSFSGDGRRVIGGQAGQMIVWETESGKEVCRMSAPRSQFHTIHRLNRDGSRAVSLAFGGGAHLWDATTGRLLAEVGEFAEKVKDAAFSPDGTLFATASADGAVRLREADGGRQLLAFRANSRGSADQVTFSPDGRRLLVLADGKKQARVWPIEGPDVRDADLVELAEFAAGKSGRSGNLLSLPPDRFADAGRLREKHPAAFAVTPDQILEFHWEQSNRARQVKDHEAVVLHNTAVLAHAGKGRTAAFLAGMLNGRGYALVQLGRHRAAEADFRAADRLEPTNDQHREWLGYALQRQGRRFAEALAVYTARAPSGPRGRVGHLNRGDCHAELAETRPAHWPFAAAHYKAALAVDAREHEMTLWRKRILALLMANDRAGCRAARAELLRRHGKTKDSDDAELVIRLCGLDSATLTKEEVQLLVKLVPVFGNRLEGNARFKMTAAMLSRTGRPSQCLQFVTEAIELTGGRAGADPEALALLAICQRERGHRFEAALALAEGWAKWALDLADRGADGRTRLNWTALRHRELLLREATAAVLGLTAVRRR